MSPPINPTDAMEAFEESIPVSAVATFPAVFVDASDRIEDVVQRPELLRFDNLPVQDEGHVVGVFDRIAAEGRRGTVREVMGRLVDRMLVASNDPMLHLVESLDREPHYRFVLQDGKVRGIVTISDLQRLAVRALLFSRVTHVELLLARWLRKRTEGQHQRWLETLSAGRRERIGEKLTMLRKNNLEVDELTASDFCDKRDAALKMGAFDDPRSAHDQLKDIEKLRNTVAHAVEEFAPQLDAAVWVVQTTRAARGLIEILNRQLRAG